MRRSDEEKRKAVQAQWAGRGTDLRYEQQAVEFKGEDGWMGRWKERQMIDF